MCLVLWQDVLCSPIPLNRLWLFLWAEKQFFSTSSTVSTTRDCDRSIICFTTLTLRKVSFSGFNALKCDKHTSQLWGALTGSVIHFSKHWINSAVVQSLQLSSVTEITCHDIFIHSSVHFSDLAMLVSIMCWQLQPSLIPCYTPLHNSFHTQTVALAPTLKPVIISVLSLMNFVL